MKNSFIMIFTDIILAAAILFCIWYFNYCVPQNGIAAYETAAVQSAAETASGSLDKPIQTLDHESSLSWKEKFADKFSDTIISTENSYKSPDISIELTQGTMHTGRLDNSRNGSKKKYGSDITYTLADIYVSDITHLKTGFAQDTFGVGYTEMLSDMSARIGSVLAVNGDSYNNNRHKENGIIIRNGVIYRSAPTNVETCVLNRDGTMKIYAPDEITEQALIDGGTYQSWIFGPSLLDENGKAKTHFLTWKYIRESHPRTAIGYYEPGHYCLLVVDGRLKNSSRGMFLDEMSQFFEDLGCKAAYNLDGGHCSFMIYDGQTMNRPYKPEQDISDGIFITE